LHLQKDRAHIFGIDGELWGEGLTDLGGPGATSSPFRMDLETGVKLDDFYTSWAGCARFTVSPDAIYSAGGRGYDRKTETKTGIPLGFKSGCNEGTLPANGSLYATPVNCKCNVSARGFVSARYAGNSFLFSPTAGVDRLTVTTNQLSGTVNTLSGDWPVYRKNNQRSAATAVSIGTATNTMWTYVPEKENVPTPIIVADGRAFLGGSDGKVRCLDSGAGTENWTFSTGGRIMAPPTLWSNRLYVTSGDGYLYTLDAGNGDLLWKYRLAPYERKIMIYGHLSSTWPANSGALIHSGRVYAAAGMCDWDGTHIYALDAIDGSLVWQNSDSAFMNTNANKGFSVYGYLTIQNGKLWMPGGNSCSPVAFDLETGVCDPGNLGFKTALRGREIGAYGDNHVLYGGTLLYGRTNEWALVRGMGLQFQALSGDGARDGNPVVSALDSDHRNVIFPAWDDEITVLDVETFKVLACWNTTQMIARLTENRNNAMTKEDAVSAVFLDEETNPAQLWQNAEQSLYGIALAGDAVVVLYANNPGYGEIPSSYWISGVNRANGAMLWTKTLEKEPMIGHLAVDRSGAILVPMTDGSVVTFYDPDNAPRVMTSASTLNVAEGTTNTVEVFLSLMPDLPVTVTVSRTSGSISLERVGSNDLVFDSSNWNSNQWLSVHALQDADYTNDEAIFTLSAFGIAGASVTATQLDDELNPVYSLPWAETFDGAEMASTLGALDGQHGWTASGATVSVAQAHSGQSAQINGGEISHLFEDACTNIQLTLWVKPEQAAQPAAIPDDATAVFYAETNGYLVAYNSTNETVIPSALFSEGWNKIKLNCDYVSKAWKLELNDQLVVSNFEFYSTNQGGFVELRIVNNSGTNAWVDTINIKLASVSSLPDVDNDGLPDEWETTYFGGATNAVPGVLSSNGVNTVMDCYIAGLDPTDPDTCFEVSGLRNNILQWSGVSGRVYNVYWASNLLSGFHPVQSNVPWTGSIFTDNTHNAEQKGFYKIEVELE